MNSKETKEIKAIINDKWDKQDKNGRDYLILKLDNGDTIFVFHSKFKEEKWNDLKIGSEYTFFCELGNNDTFILVEVEGESNIWI